MTINETVNNNMANIKEYSIFHIEKVPMMAGTFVYGMFLLKKGKVWYSTFLGWASELPRRFRKHISKFTPKFEYPVMTDEITISYLEQWQQNEEESKRECESLPKSNIFSGIYNKGKDEIAVEKFLKSVFNRDIVDFNEYISQILHRHCWGDFIIDDETHKKRVDFLLHDLYFFGYEKMNEKWTEEAKEKYKENTTPQAKERAIACIKHIAENAIVCPFIFPEIILDRQDGEIKFVVTPKTVYYSIRRSI